MLRDHVCMMVVLTTTNEDAGSTDVVLVTSIIYIIAFGRQRT